MSDAFARQISGIALLAEPVRRALYLYVSRQPEPVSRDQAASAVRATRENAAFHLDRLVEEGLLEASFRRLSGKAGPGAGRPSKLYRRAGRQLEVTLPARRYQLAAELLAQALDARPGTEARTEAAAAARALGRSLGTAARERAGQRSSRGRPLRQAIDVLDENGFEPAESPRGVVRLRNCPFDPLPRDHRDLVCGMNLAFIQGVLVGMGARGITATRDQQPGICCVVLRAAP